MSDDDELSARVTRKAEKAEKARIAAELKLQAAAQIPVNPVPKKMAHIGSIEIFDVSKPRDWVSYKQRCEFYYAANDIDNAIKQRACFLSMCGKPLFELLCALISPAQAKDTAFNVIIKALDEHFSPKPSEIASFYNFFKRDQEPDEDFAHYLAEIRRLATDCNFGQSLDRMLRDRIVCGLRDESLQRNLLAEKDLTLARVTEKSQAAETATKNLLDIRHSEAVKFVSGRSHNGHHSHRSVSHKFSNNVDSTHSKVTCNGCGGNHERRDCSHRDTVCSNCGIKGHLQKVCRQQQKKPPNKSPANRNRRKNRKHVGSVNAINLAPAANGPEKSTTVTLNQRPCVFEIDTGSNFTLISKATFDHIWPSNKPNVEKCHLILLDYQKNPIPLHGVIDVPVQYHNRAPVNLPIVIADGKKTSVLGYSWFPYLGISLHGVHSIESTVAVKNVVEKFDKLFSKEMGCYKGPPVSLNYDTSVQPIRLPPRNIPIAIKPKVEAELKRLIDVGILKPTDYSDWTTPIVPVLKKDGSIRICGDYKSTLNKALKPHCFQIPAIMQLITSISGAQVFAKLDLAQAYQQLSVDKKSSELQTIITHKGAFRVNRLQYGISSAPGIFQSFIENLLQGIPGVVPYFDDVVVVGSSTSELASRLNSVLSRFEETNLRLRRDKCVFGTSSIDFLGFKIDSLGIRPMEQKVAAIKNAPSPQNKQQLQAFLGLLNFYHVFLKQKASIAEPLHRLLDKSCSWKWTPVQEKSFNDLKSLLTSKTLLTHYNEKLPLLLCCDASPYGLGVVLAHSMEDGTERPIAFYSRTLSSAERNYAQIDREAVAIIAGVKKFHNFLYGRNFTIITDHRPLLGIFNPNKPTSTVISLQMLRRRIILNGYDYNIIHRAGKKMGNADSLSRLPDANAKEETVTIEDELLMIETIDMPLINAAHIAQMTSEDPIFAQVLSWALRGWPRRLVKNKLNIYSPFFTRRHEISTTNGCIVWGNRVIIPERGRAVILKALHHGHLGMVRMKQLARSYFWWPRLDSDIENLVKQCADCQHHRPEMPQTMTHPWLTPSTPWSRIHVDFAGPFQSKLFFIVVDAYSKWLDVSCVSSTSSSCAISALRHLFATHGIPDAIVSDNGTSFTSNEFKQFCRHNFIDHILTPPFHPSSNGQAERMVRTTKDFLKKVPQGDINLRLSRFLLTQHTTPGVTGKSPADLLFNRHVNTYFDKLNPDNIKLSSHTETTSPGTRALQVHDDVWVRNYAAGHKWISGTVMAKTGPVTYEIKSENGNILRRHIDQLRKRDSHATIPVADESDEPEPTAISISTDLNLHSPVRESREHLQSTSDDSELRRSERVRQTPRFYPDTEARR